MHAGGIAWYGEWLYVVDTSHGIRVFDLGQIWQVEDGDDVGKKGGKYSAAGYLYVLPQIRYVDVDCGGVSESSLESQLSPHHRSDHGSQNHGRAAEWSGLGEIVVLKVDYPSMDLSLSIF